MTPDVSTGRDLKLFFFLAFAWSWSWWVPMVLTMRLGEVEGIPVWALLAALVGGYGPSLAALVVAGRSGGKSARRELLRGLIKWRVGGRWHLAAWLLPPLVLIGGLALYRASGGTLPDPEWARAARIPFALIFAVLFGPLGEELGWRGFALPRLQVRLTAWRSSLALGVIWTAWHLPLFWAPGGTTISGSPVTIQAVGIYLATLIGLSVIHTWLFNSSGGSTLLSLVLHLSGNAAVPFLLLPELSSEAGRTIEYWSAVPIWLVAGALLLVMGPRVLSRQPAVRSPE